MKHQTTPKSPSLIHRLRRFAPLFTGVAAMAALITLPSRAQAQNQLLVDPGAELATAGSAVFTGWTQWGGGGAFVGNGTDPGVAPFDGLQYFKIWGNYGNATDWSGFFQTFGAHAGEVFNASAEVYQNSGDGFGTGDANNAYLEVQFKDVNGTVLANYQSAHYVTGMPQDQWLSLTVTNETAPTPGLVTSLVAPTNTVLVEYDVVMNLVNYGGGSTYWDGLSLVSFAPPPPFVTNLAPGNVIMATNTALTFGAVAQSGNITNIQVTLTAVSGLNNPTTNSVTYTTPSTNITVSGLGTPSVTASVPLAANKIYNVTVLITDSNAGSAVGSSSFDTLQPTLLWEAEDFNFNSGQFIDTPADGGVGLYANLVGVQGIDENKLPGTGQPHLYRPSDAVSIQGAGETAREKFLNAIAEGNTTNSTDEEVGYNSAGDWLNYTRTFPAGNYNIYARMATVGSGPQVNIGLVGGDTTSSSQTVTNLGVCNLSDQNWNGYLYCPLVDSFGNLVTVHLSGKETLRSTIVAGGNPNINFYMVLPATGSPNPALISSYPTGAHPFEPTNKLSFTIGPANGSVINSNAIHLSLNGADVTAQLSFTAGVSNQWTATAPVLLNTIYAAVINVTNTTSLHSSFTINFDTFSQTNFMFEAEDFDFNGGSYLENPVPSFDPTISGGGVLEPNSYYGFPDDNSANADIAGVDDNWVIQSGQASIYRSSPVATQVASDYLRQKFLDSQTALSDPNIADVNIGYWVAGLWLNYTRSYPAGNYYIYGRLAGGAGAFSGTTLAAVTAGLGTTSQTTNVLGSFADATAAGWQTWHWVPLLTNGVRAVISLGGVSTFQISSGNNVNANYYMLVPAPAAAGPLTLKVSLSGNQPAISFPTVSGHNYTLLYKSNLTDATWTSVTLVPGDGTTKTLMDTTGSGAAHRFYTVQVQ